MHFLRNGNCNRVPAVWLEVVVCCPGLRGLRYEYAEKTNMARKGCALSGRVEYG